MTAVDRVNLEPSYVLHQRAYRETSELLDVITVNHGVVSLVARGTRRPRSGLRAILQPFQPLLVSWSGRGGSLMTMRSAEADGARIGLDGTALMSAFYINELSLRFLHKGDPHPRLFAAYKGALAWLGRGDPPEPALRRFELELLAESGYGLSLENDAATGEPLDPDGWYHYVVERGPVAAVDSGDRARAFTGAELMAIGEGRFRDNYSLQRARQLLREVLDHYLGEKPLRTRQVFLAMRR